MAKRDSDNHTGRTVVLVGGGALLLWLLFRGKGKGGLGRDGDGSGVAGQGATREPPCRVFIRARQVDLDGAPADLSTVVARCRASGRADVQATGGASLQRVEDVIRALQAAGVTVAAPPDVWDSFRTAPAIKP